MSVEKSLELKAQVLRALNQAIPLPATPEDWQTRMFALVDTMADEIARWLQHRNPGVELPSQFVAAQATSFASEMLIPFTVASVQQLQRQPKESVN